MFKKLFFILLFCFLLPISAFADEWYVKNFDTQINVNQDSSLSITEKITADCGNAYGKHGIFRVLPTKMNIDGKLINTPVQLISITDFYGNPIMYSIIRDFSDSTITFKIGDPNVTVQGVNYYQISYYVKNAVRINDLYDQLYWNLTGNFWDMNIDSFSGEIVFPETINSENTETQIFIGELGSRNTIFGYWQDNILNVSNSTTLYPGTGISMMVDLPKNIFTPSQLTFLEKYLDILQYLWLLIPIIVFFICFFIWKKHGKDFVINKAITPEFEPPANMSPADVGLLYNFGLVDNQVITSTLINLATKGVLKIEELQKVWLLGSKDYKFTIINKEKLKDVSESEKIIIDEIFGLEDYVTVSGLKLDFQKILPTLQKKIKALMYNQGLLIDNKKIIIKMVFIPIAIIAIVGFIISRIPGNSFIIALSIFSSFIIYFIFATLLSKRTKKGAELLWQIKGFNLYMRTAEQYRQRFFEKENMFEKLLPYAIVFGMTKIWLKKVETIYAQENKTFSYVPIWFSGASFASFDIDSFTTSLNSISSGIASSTYSGAGGGGAGGGGGGGGGGGW